MARTGRREMAELLSAKEMIVVCGSGGTGKTTIAAALGAQAAAVVGGRVLVLTVDPARRLATALGIGSFGNTAVRVPPQAFVEAGLECRGELWVAMLDTKAGWDELIRRHAPDAKLRDTVLANPLYRNITGRFVNSHDYLAMEQLYDLHASGQYDLVVIDTPPSRNALDLLDAPGRMREFFGSRLLKWLTVPYRSRLFTMASKPFYQVADRILGSRFLHDIAEFFVLFQTMEAGFVARAKEVERLLTDDGTSFIVVSTLEAAPAREARYLAEELQRRRMPLGALVLNRTLPAAVRQPAVAKAAGTLAAATGDPQLLAELGAATGCDVASVQHVLAEVAARFRDVTVVAGREAERRRELEAVVQLTVVVPTMAGDVHDLPGLLAIGEHLLGSGKASSPLPAGTLRSHGHAWRAHTAAHATQSRRSRPSAALDRRVGLARRPELRRLAALRAGYRWYVVRGGSCPPGNRPDDLPLRLRRHRRRRPGSAVALEGVHRRRDRGRRTGRGGHARPRANDGRAGARRRPCHRGAHASGPAAPAGNPASWSAPTWACSSGSRR